MNFMRTLLDFFLFYICSSAFSPVETFGNIDLYLITDHDATDQAFLLFFRGCVYSEDSRHQESGHLWSLFSVWVSISECRRQPLLIITLLIDQTYQIGRRVCNVFFFCVFFFSYPSCQDCRFTANVSNLICFGRRLTIAVGL